MSAVVQRMGHNTALNDAFTGPTRLVTVDTEARNQRLHDGSTAGGFRVSGQTVIDRVTTGLSKTVTIKGWRTQVVWRSSSSGAKTTNIPASSAANNGCEILIATTLANGDAHTITPASGTIQGASTFTFTDNPRANVSMISDGASTDWIIT